MPTEKNDARLKGYREETLRGVKSLTRLFRRSDESRLAPKTHWEERWVGVIHGYPKTPEAFEARRERGRAQFAKLRAEGRLPTRKGIPDGWSGQREEIAKIKSEAAKKGSEIVDRLIAEGALPVDEELGNDALRIAYAIMLDVTVAGSLRVKAAQIITEWTKPKPVKQTETILTPAEEWLTALHHGVADDDTEDHSAGT